MLHCLLFYYIFEHRNSAVLNHNQHEPRVLRVTCLCKQATVKMAAVTPERAHMSPASFYKRHPSGKPLTSSQKQTIMNVYSQLRQRDFVRSIREVVKETALLCGVSETAVFHCKKQFKATGGLMTTPRKTQPVRTSTTRKEKYDQFTLSAIRNKVHDFFRLNDVPTVEKVRRAVNADTDLPDFSPATMRRVMIDLGFVFKKRRRESLLIERDDIVLWRRRYLREMKKHRANNRTIYYLDETWANAGQTNSKVWADTTVKSKRDAFGKGLTTGLKAPSGKGGRLIILHAGNEDGFVPAADLVFRAKKGGGDYHDEMDGDRFEDWFTKQLLPNIKPNSVIVMDNASYHSVKIEKIPTKSSVKAVMQAWLREKNVSFDTTMLNRELFALIERERPQYDHHRIDTLASLHGHTVLRLPPYHCELNPIELVWAQVKRYVAANNKTFKIGEVEDLIPKAFSEVKVDNWSDCVKHVIKQEEKMWEADGLSDLVVEHLGFQVNGPSSDEASSNSEMSGIEELE